MGSTKLSINLLERMKIFLPIFLSSAVIALDFEIKEWHFHPYFHQTKPESLAEGKALHEKVLSEIRKGSFFAVTEGIEDYYESIGMPISPDSWVGAFDEEPVGPHPVGQFQLWVPIEYLGPVWSFIAEKRGNLTVLLHPVTGNRLEEHRDMAMWQGGHYDIYFDAFTPEHNEGPPTSQFPELGLGYAGDYVHPEPVTSPEPATSNAAKKFVGFTGLASLHRYFI